MSFQGDPYRILGVTPGASLNEIRSAYRRLAKQYHPDAAGERALPRFLAIQAAYERLVDAEGRLRGASGGRSGAGGSPGEPWRADPSRARASRDAWRARRAGASPGGAGTGATRTGAGPGTAGTTGGTPGTGPGVGGVPPRGGRRSAGGASSSRDHARRGPRKATPGSTTYDEAAEIPRDPEWDGGSWYGPTSRTYWTINPREYADPRKHGPDYLERARRAASREAAGEPATTGAGREPEASWAWMGHGSTATGEGPMGGTAADPDGDPGRDDAWGARSWTYTTDDPSAGRARGGGETVRRPTGGPAYDDRAPAPPLPDLESLARRAAPRELLALANRPDRRWRLALALAGWPPIGYALATLLTTITGCARFSASCPEPVPVLAWVIQPFIVAALFLLPSAAALAAFGSIIALAIAVPVTAVLSVGASPESRVGAPVLGVAVEAAYLVALAAGARSLWRLPRLGGTDPP